ncbi:MAG: beta-lactamase family protein [Cyclobacteriaceae bacterium]
MKKFIAHILLISLSFFTLKSSAQVDSTWTEKIDSLFINWNTPNHPGGAVAVMKDGKMIFSRAYGMASLEYLVPNSTGTIFNTGSVSKQFTAMGIVRLEEEGKLSFDDDIHKYIPELPDFGETITIRHLLHHTSGLRSLHALFALAGWRGDDSRTNEDLNRIILNQNALNFKPGSEFLYCNSGYMLMVNIVEKITGEKFKDWMKDNIFDELNMSSTYVEDQYSRVVPNNATSYYGKSDFDRAVEYWGYVGSGNMHSTTNDLLKWLSNFNEPQPGWESSFKKMQTIDPLKDGSENNYAFGVFVNEHLGRKRIGHGGAIGGFRASIATYPTENLNIVVLTNFSAGNPGGNSNNIAEIILGSNNVKKSKEGVTNNITLSTDQLKRFEGQYWNEREKYSRKIYLKNDTLRYSRSKNNENPVIPISDNVFRMLNVAANLLITFEKKKGVNQMSVSVGKQSPSIFNQIIDLDVSKAELSEYVGQYYSSEVETTYRISIKSDSIQIYHPRHGAIPLEPLFQDILKGSWPIGSVEIGRDSNEKVSGIFISNGRVRNAWFKKQ